MLWLLDSIFDRTPTTTLSTTMQGESNNLKRKCSADDDGEDDDEWSDVSSDDSARPVEGNSDFSDEELALLPYSMSSLSHSIFVPATTLYGEPFYWLFRHRASLIQAVQD
jgi:hypothetical protein